MSPSEDPRDILANVKTIAVVGLSPNPSRDSHRVARYLQAHGYRIVPVNPHATEVLGERAYPSLRDVPEPIDLVDVFRRPEHVPGIVDDAIVAGAKAIWLQLGVVHEDAAAKARAHGIPVVMDRCALVEHRRYFGR